MINRSPLGVLLIVGLTACASATPANGLRESTDVAAEAVVPVDAPEALKVVATTTLVGDVARRIGGDAIDLTVMLPAGADPHGFQPTPRDVAAVADADVVFASGLGLETFLASLIENAGGGARIVEVSDGIETIAFAGGYENETGHEDQREDEHAEGAVDPHVWFDPNNVAVWADNVAATLSDLDPDRANQYATGAGAYQAELAALDAWIREEVAALPEDRRQLVTDHDTFGYFAKRYGFAQVGTLLGFSTLAEPSAAELAALEDTIADLGVRAIFVGTTANPSLAKRVAEDTGTRVVTLYTGALSEPGGPADSYEAFMRHNVSAIVDALR